MKHSLAVLALLGAVVLPASPAAACDVAVACQAEGNDPVPRAQSTTPPVTATTPAQTSPPATTETPSPSATTVTDIDPAPAKPKTGLAIALGLVVAAASLGGAAWLLLRGRSA